MCESGKFLLRSFTNDVGVSNVDYINVSNANDCKGTIVNRNQFSIFWSSNSYTLFPLINVR